MAQTLAICIGAQKAGTTWLADYLRARPDVHCPPVKEVHYFDARFAPTWCAKYEAEMLADFQREAASLTVASAGMPAVNQKLAALLLRFRMIAEPDGYLKFMRWGAGARPVLFEATPDYAMISEAGFAAMRAVQDDVRLIFIMRNPADRFWSSLQFNRTHNPSFDVEAMFGRLIGREDFRLLADYGRTISALRAAFPSDRLHLVFYEDLFTPATIDAICAFLGLPPSVPDFKRRANASGGAPMPSLRRAEAVAAYAHVYRDIAAMFPTALPRSWRDDLVLL